MPEPNPSAGKVKDMSNRIIKVDALARVEGEGGLYVRVRDDRVVEIKLNIFEPPRLFEAFLRGRHYSEVPDLVARICGICPVAHQLTACQAIESAFGTVIAPGIRDLRRLLYCGEWIASHVLHVAFLHAPDYLGYEDALRMSADHREVFESALRLKKIGNELVRIIGGREVHPVNVRVGGFYKLPSRTDLQAIGDDLIWAREAAAALLRWTATLDMPDFERDYELVALVDSDAYAITEGRIQSSGGVNIGAQDYERRFPELQVPHSSALHSMLDGCTTYLCGPLARWNHNHRRLTQRCRDEAARAGLSVGVRNPFAGIKVRMVETLYAVEEALRLIEQYKPAEQACASVVPRMGTGCSCTEAPRGLLFHRYTISERQLVQDARIVPPTAQNLRIMEEDLRSYVESHLSLPQDQLVRRCEQVIRNYDPCLSCSAHCMNVRLDFGRGEIR